MSASPRVLVSGIVLGQPMGGVRRHNAELLPRAAEILRADGGGLTVLEGALRPTFALPEHVERIRTRVPHRPLAIRALLERRALIHALRTAAEAGRPFHLVHTGHLPAPRGLPVPFTITLHDLRDLELASVRRTRRLVARRVTRGAVERAACTITVSETMREELERRFEPRAVRVVPNAADHLLVQERGAGPEAPLLHVGHLEPRKNLSLLLRSLALDPGLPDLVLAGAPKHGHDQRLRRLARELGVEQRVHFLGLVSDEALPGLYATASCAVFPSELEGFGIGVVEAQRALVPVAISEAGALPEVAGPDVPRFRPDDPAGAARAIRSALAQPSGILADHAQRSARTSWDGSAVLLVEAWRSAAGRLSP